MRKLLVIALTGILWATSGAALADGLLDGVDIMLKEPLRLVAEWESDRRYALGIVAMVFILGAVIAFIHSLPTAKAKMWAVALGCAVTVLTGLSNLYFEFDHRQYKALASEGRSLLAEIDFKKIQLKDIPPDQKSNRDAIFEAIRTDARAIMTLAKNTKDGKPIPPVGMLFSTAWAQQARAPAWTTKVPTDDANLYFIGYADGRDYQAVRKASVQGAYDDARSFVTGQLESADKTTGVDAAAAAKYLLDAASIADSYTAYDKTQNTYQAYTLLSLSKKLAGTDLRLFSAKNSQPVTAAQSQALQAAVRKPGDYLAQRMQVYTGESVKAQSVLSADQYDQFNRARKLRQEGNAAEAIPQLKEVVRLKPDFYLGWFNLALAYDERGDFPAAKTAYESAIQLESKGQLRDASLYNSYGYFLFRNKKYPEAIANLKHALKLAPDHPKAKNTLAAAEARM